MDEPIVCETCEAPLPDYKCDCYGCFWNFGKVIHSTYCAGCEPDGG